MSRNIVLAVAISAVAACGRDRGADREVTIPLPNTYTPAKEGLIELTKYLDKVVVTNHSDQRAWDCVVMLDGGIRGELGELLPRATVTLMQTRFKPYTEPDDFYARAKQSAIMECMTADEGLVRVRFGGGPEYTVPADALRKR